MQLLKIITLLLFTIPYKAIPHWKGQRLNFQKKIFQSQETHNIPQKKLTRHISAKKFFKFIKNVILPGNVSILCNMVGTSSSISKQNNPKIVRRNRATWNFQQIYFETLSDYANRIIIISIITFYTSASLVLKWFTLHRRLFSSVSIEISS